MRKIKCSVHYPWAGVKDDEYIVEVDDNATEEEIEETANEVLSDMIWSCVSASWKEIE